MKFKSGASQCNSVPLAVRVQSLPKVSRVTVPPRLVRAAVPAEPHMVGTLSGCTEEVSAKLTSRREESPLPLTGLKRYNSLYPEKLKRRERQKTGERHQSPAEVIATLTLWK